MDWHGPPGEYRETTSPASRHTLDIIGIGALNLDYIADTHSDEHLRRLMSEGYSLADSDSLVEFDWGTETAVDEKTVYGVLESVDSSSLTTSLGGSAFNAVYALAQMKLDLRLGYVGVAGRTPLQGLSSLEELHRHGVDTAGVHRAEGKLAGVCLSLMDRGERTLLTHAGANALMGELIEQNFAETLAYLERAQIVHVTSFLDQVTPECLLRLLEALRESRPDVLITFDPGHVWATERSPAVLGMAAISDYLLLNYHEFRALGQFTDGDTDEKIGAAVLQLINKDRGVVLVKHANGTTVFRKSDQGIDSHFFRQHPLSDDEIQDATGAGDVFAAGLLAVLASSRLQLELGALLGMRLARQKLRYIGNQGHASFPDLTRKFIAARNAERLAQPDLNGIFIAHGGDPQWLAVKDYIEHEFRVPVHSFESGIWGSSQITSALNEYLAVCSMAICILTVEDLVNEGRGFARQNVVHEVGLFQGRYGPDRVIVLVEDGCEFLPDIGSTQPLVFSRRSVRQSFWSLKEELLRKGIRAH